MAESHMIERKTWEDFRSAGLLWFINRTLHLFGYAIVFDYDENKILKDVYPARCRFRGFSEKDESEGFIKVTKYLRDNVEILDNESLQ